MISYEELLQELHENSDVAYREFNSKICVLPQERTIGVRVPILRKIGKRLASCGKEELDIICHFPDVYFEVTFVKCLAVGYCKLNITDLIHYLDCVVPLIDNWAICDCLAATLKSVESQRKEFLPYIAKCASDQREFVQRFAFVCLLDHYTVPEYFETEFSLMSHASCSLYYVHMAVAWLLAEIFVKDFYGGVKFVSVCSLPSKTINKGIQKARESYRLTQEQKNYLKSLKK